MWKTIQRINRVLGRIALAAVLGILGMAPVHAAIGDDPASVIATRTAPGETTAFVCGSSGFIIVQFFLGTAIVSEIESGTTCTPGVAIGGPGLPAADAVQYVDENLNDFFPLLFDGDLFGDFGIPSSPFLPPAFLGGDIGGAAQVGQQAPVRQQQQQAGAGGQAQAAPPNEPGFACLRCRDELAKLESRLENAKALREFVENRLNGLKNGDQGTIEAAGLGKGDVEDTVRKGVEEGIAALEQQRNIAIADLNRLRFDPGFFFPTLFDPQGEPGTRGTDQVDDRVNRDIGVLVAKAASTNGDNSNLILDENRIEGAAEAFASINVGGDAAENIDDRIADAGLTFRNAFAQAQNQQSELDRQQTAAFQAIADAAIGKLQGKAEDVALDVAKKGGRTAVAALSGPLAPATGTAFNIAFNIGVAFEEEITSGRFRVGKVISEAFESTKDDFSELSDQTAAILLVPLFSDAAQEEKRQFGIAAVQLKKAELLIRLKKINQRITELRNLTDEEIDELTDTAQEQAIQQAIAQDQARIDAFDQDIQNLEAEIAAKKAECDRICADDKNASLKRSEAFVLARNTTTAAGAGKGMQVIAAGKLLPGGFGPGSTLNGSGRSILEDPRLNVFLSTSVSISEDGRVAGLDGTSLSASAGASWMFSDHLNVGVAARFHSSDVSGVGQNLKGHAWSLALFAQTRLPADVALDLGLAYGRSNTDGTFNNAGTFTTADVDANVFAAQISASRAFQVESFSVQPNLGLTLTHSDRGAFQLSDGQFAPGNNDTSVFLRGGVGIARSTPIENGFTLSTSAGLGAFYEITEGRTGLSASGALGLVGNDGTSATAKFSFSGPSDDQFSGTGSLNFVVPFN